MIKTWTGPEEKLTNISSEILGLVQNQSPNFVLLLRGQMGAGKTALTRETMYLLGLTRGTPVQSPTFSYFNDYEIEGKKFAHIDLYRMEEAMDLEDFFGISFSDYSGVFIEWPNSSLLLSDLTATHELTIELINGGEQRCYKLDTLSRRK